MAQGPAASSLLCIFLLPWRQRQERRGRMETPGHWAVPSRAPGVRRVDLWASRLRSCKHGPQHCACSERPLPPAASPPRRHCGRSGSRGWRRTVPSLLEPVVENGLTEDLAARRKPRSALAPYFSGQQLSLPQRPGETSPISASIPAGVDLGCSS